MAAHSLVGMIAQTLMTTKGLPFQIKHAVLGATCAKNPKSDLGKAMAAYLGKVSAAGKKPDPREMSEVMTKVRSDVFPDNTVLPNSSNVFWQNCYDEKWIQEHPQLYERRIQQAISTRRPGTTVALQQRAIGKYDVREKLRSVPSTLKVLVIHGSLDVAVYPEEVQYITEAMPHAKVLKDTPAEFAHNWCVVSGSFRLFVTYVICVQVRLF